MKMPGKCEGRMWMGIELDKGPLESARHGKKSGPEWRGDSVVQEVLGLCWVSSGAEADEPW